jgi:hypothetical protein
VSRQRGLLAPGRGWLEAAFQAFSQFGQLYWIDDKIIHAGGHAIGVVVVHGVCRQRDDEERLASEALADAPGRFQAIDTRQTKIHEDGVPQLVHGEVDGVILEPKNRS